MIIKEKEKFKLTPRNYAMKKAQLMKDRDMAMSRNEDAIVRELNTQIAELEERASQLDKQRTSSISSISYINDRNRKRNVEQAEKAIIEELKATKGIFYVVLQITLIHNKKSKFLHLDKFKIL